MFNRKKIKLLSQTFLKFRFMLIPTSNGRVKFIRRHNLFDNIGQHVMWAPHTLPTDPKLVRLHNNIKVAADVTFINHDVLYDLYNHMDPDFKYTQNLGCIEVLDNVFIGRGSIILPDVVIGPNAIIAAGSVVTKDVEEGTIVGGNPAKVIGDFHKTMNRQREISNSHPEGGRFSDERIAAEWKFFAKRKGSGEN